LIFCSCNNAENIIEQAKKISQSGTASDVYSFIEESLGKSELSGIEQSQVLEYTFGVMLRSKDYEKIVSVYRNNDLKYLVDLYDDEKSNIKRSHRLFKLMNSLYEGQKLSTCLANINQIKNPTDLKFAKLNLCSNIVKFKSWSHCSKWPSVNDSNIDSCIHLAKAVSQCKMGDRIPNLPSVREILEFREYSYSNPIVDRVFYDDFYMKQDKVNEIKKYEGKIIVLHSSVGQPRMNRDDFTFKFYFEWLYPDSSKIYLGHKSYDSNFWGILRHNFTNWEYGYNRVCTQRLGSVLGCKRAGGTMTGVDPWIKLKIPLKHNQKEKMKHQLNEIEHILIRVMIKSNSGSGLVEMQGLAYKLCDTLTNLEREYKQPTRLDFPGCTSWIKSKINTTVLENEIPKMLHTKPNNIDRGMSGINFFKGHWYFKDFKEHYFIDVVNRRTLSINRLTKEGNLYTGKVSIKPVRNDFFKPYKLKANRHNKKIFKNLIKEKIYVNRVKNNFSIGMFGKELNFIGDESYEQYLKKYHNDLKRFSPREVTVVTGEIQKNKSTITPSTVTDVNESEKTSTNTPKITNKPANKNIRVKKNTQKRSTPRVKTPTKRARKNSTSSKQRNSASKNKKSSASDLLKNLRTGKTGSKKPLDLGKTAKKGPKKPSKSDIVNTMRRVNVRRCGSRDPSLKGTIKVRIKAVSSGAIIQVKTQNSPFNTSPVGSCIEREVKKQRFPSFTDNKIEFTFPFKL
jgi:hypothetical protein